MLIILYKTFSCTEYNLTYIENKVNIIYFYFTDDLIAIHAQQASKRDHSLEHILYYYYYVVPGQK